MFFLGSTQLTLTKQTTDFYCPDCDSQRTFKVKVVRQFLTVYFIPLIPLQVMKEFVQCTSCSKQYDAANITRDKVSYEKLRQQRALEVIRQTIVLIVAADDTVSDQELEVVRNFSRQYMEVDSSAEQILEEATNFHHFEVDPEQWIRQVARNLSDDEQDLLVYHAFLAASASGDLSDTRQGLLGQLPELLEMPETRFRQIINRAVEAS